MNNILTVVILAYNRCQDVLETLEKLKEYRRSIAIDFEIVVVDNASVDNTRSEVPKVHPDINFIHKDKNNGIAGWNEGFKYVESKYILVLDDDSCIEQGLTDALQFMDNHPKIGILGLNIVDQQLKGDPLLDPDEAWQHRQLIPGFIGCGAIIRTELYRKIGGFAEWIYVYTHEFEYSMRARQAGYEVVFFDEATVVHRTSAVNRSSKRQRIFATRNELAIVYKYFSYNRSKYLLRTFVNNLKFMKREGLLSAWYVLLGGFKFLSLMQNLPVSPVNNDTQDFYARNFWSTQPIFKKQRVNIHPINLITNDK